MDKCFPIVTICGSMRFYRSMIIIAEKLTFAGYIVLMPFASKDKIEARTNEEFIDAERMLDAMHKVKIDMADIILVVDIDILTENNTQNSYMGHSTVNEVDYAIRRNKWLRRLSLIDFQEEPMILN